MSETDRIDHDSDCIRFKGLCDCAAGLQAKIDRYCKAGRIAARYSPDGELSIRVVGRNERFSKEGILAHYSTRTPQKFLQFDGFMLIADKLDDDLMRPDADGDTVYGQIETWELMTGLPRVRVLIKPGTHRTDVLRLLRKISDWIERDGIGDSREGR